MMAILCVDRFFFPPLVNNNKTQLDLGRQWANQIRKERIFQYHFVMHTYLIPVQTMLSLQPFYTVTNLGLSQLVVQ